LDEPVQVVRHDYERECIGVTLKFRSHHCTGKQAAVCEGSKYSGSLVRCGVYVVDLVLNGIASQSQLFRTFVVVFL
jgi:hypothetical protein